MGREQPTDIVDVSIPGHKMIGFPLLFGVEYLLDGNVIELHQGQLIRYMVGNPAACGIAF